VVDLLKENFSGIVDVEFTAKMEEDLDLVEEGELNWKQVVRNFYHPFAQDLEKASALVQKIEIKDEEAGKDCPECGRPMLIKHGRFGKFLACSGFPDCRHTESFVEEVGVECPLCGGDIIALKSKKGRRFFGCSNYPACEFRSWNKPTGEKCPVCGDILVEKQNRKKESMSACHNSECKFSKEMTT
jgi:DNA topoisomerase-1